MKKHPDLELAKEPTTIVITSISPWYMRLWYLVSNPFRYLFTGKIVY
jgi:hypothetical protein